MWFSVVCTLIDNDIRHHSDQNLLWTHSAAPRESTTFCGLNLLIRIYLIEIHHRKYKGKRVYVLSRDLSGLFLDPLVCVEPAH